MSTTSDLTKFGFRELKMLELLLTAMREQGLPEGFERQEVTPMFNQKSGCVFLTNSEYQAAMLTGDNKLELWFNCSYCGHEGFLNDFDHEAQDDDCKQAMVDAHEVINNASQN